MNGGSRQRRAGRAAAAVLSGAAWARILRVLLVFTLVFWSTQHVAIHVALAADPGNGAITDIKIKPDGPYTVKAGTSIELRVNGVWTETQTKTETIHHDAERETVTKYFLDGKEVPEGTEGAEAKSDFVLVKEAWDETKEVTKQVEHDDFNVARWLKWSSSTPSVKVEVKKGTDDKDKDKDKQDADVLVIAAVADAEGQDVTITCQADKNPHFKDEGFKREFTVHVSSAGGSGGGGDDTPASYAYVEGIEIRAEDGTALDRASGSARLALSDQVASTYDFRADVSVRMDSNDPSSTVHYTCTPTNNLAAQTDGDLADVVWDVVVESGGAAAASIDSARGTLTIQPGAKATVTCTSKQGVGWKLQDEAPVVADAVLVDTTGGAEATAYTLTYDPNGGAGTMAPVVLSINAATGTAAGVVAECSFEPPAANGAARDASAEGGSGQDTEGEVSNVAGEGTLPTGAEPGAAAGVGVVEGTGDGPDAPDGEDKQATAIEFESWNTKADGSGDTYHPGDEIVLAADTTLFAQWAGMQHGDCVVTFDANDGSGDQMEPKTASAGETIELPECTYTAPGNKSFLGWGFSPIVAEGDTLFHPGDALEVTRSMTMFAIWEIGEGLACEISYVPVKKDEWATLTAVAYGTGDAMFGFLWERSTDGSNWEPVDGSESYINNESVQSLRVLTSDATIGMLFRATVMTSGSVEPIDDETGDDEADDSGESQSAISHPVAIKEGDGALRLTYEPVKYGETALFKATSALPQDNGYTTVYEWHVSSNSGNRWEVIEGVNGLTYAVATVEGNLGNLYRVSGTVSKAGEEDEIHYSEIQMLTAKVDDDVPVGPDDGDGDTSDPIGDTSGDTSEPVEGFSDTSDPVYWPSETSEPIEPAPQLRPSTDPHATPIDIVLPGMQQPNSDRTAVVIDPQVQERISEADIVTKEEQEATTPGARWRKLDVIPTQEEIQELLADNPFASFVIPSFVGLVAAGVVERLLAFRREKRPGSLR